MPTQSLRILLCGDFDNAELRPVAAFTETIAAPVDVKRVADLRSLPAESSDDADAESHWNPDLVIVAQLRPDQFSKADVRRLQANYPLARCICCCGVWCESEGRNSTLWPDAVRVSARTATARIRREIAVVRNRIPPLPLTASRDEIFEFDSPGDWDVEQHELGVQVITPDRELRQTLEGLLTSGGFKVRAGTEDDRAKTVVWDVDPWDESRANEIRDFQRKHDGSRIVALMNFGHPQAEAEVLACGAHAVVAKLSPAEILFEAIRTATISIAR